LELPLATELITSSSSERLSANEFDSWGMAVADMGNSLPGSSEKSL
jgi:hypothetical protein